MMDIKQCFEILEVTPDTTSREIKEAYKDLVTIWHPDKYSNNPRLRQKAENKLKDINVAYETVNSFLVLKHKVGTVKKENSPATHEVRVDPEPEFKPNDSYYKSQYEPEPTDKVEVVFETGTHKFLNICSSLYKAFCRTVDNLGTQLQTKQDLSSHNPGRDFFQGRGSTRERGREFSRCKGKGMGMGRRKGSSMGRGSGRRR